MGCKHLAAFFFVIFITGVKQSFVETAPFDLKPGNGDFNDETVQELESLKSLLGEKEKSDEEVVVSKSQTSFFSGVNGRESAHKEIKNEVNKNGKMFAKIAQKVDMIKEKGEKPKSFKVTEVEIPSKGIKKVIVKNDEKLDPVAVSKKKLEGSDMESFASKNGIDKMNSLSGLEYSPLDMAEYIFWTGDEKGIALTIEEFLEEGLMTRQEAINFLQSVKFNLDSMQEHYLNLKKNGKKFNKMKNLKQETEKQKSELYEDGQMNTKVSPYDITRSKPSFEVLPEKVQQNSLGDHPNLINEDNNEQEYDKGNNNRMELKSLKKLFNGMSVSDEDYDEILERLKVADFLYKEYSLEEVIFQLAKVMFSQSLTKGSKEAQKALQRFTSFLQMEVKHGQISRNLERKILDVLISALMDTLTEHPELMAAAKEGLQNMSEINSPTSAILKQLLMPGIEGKSSNMKRESSEKNLLSEKKNVSLERSFKKLE